MAHFKIRPSKDKARPSAPSTDDRRSSAALPLADRGRRSLAHLPLLLHIITTVAAAVILSI
jgi:hypothetical protein